MLRRDFLKLCLVGLQGTTLSPLLQRAAEGKEKLGAKQVSRHTKKFLRGVSSICQLCPARCGIVGFLEGDKLVKIGGNTNHPNSLGKLCARGLSGVSLAYDPDRIVSPMIRRGERGKGQWEKISWEKAYMEIVSRLKSIYRSGKSGEFVFESDSPPTGLTRRFLEGFGNVLVLDDQSLGFANRDKAHWLTWGEDRGVPDIKNSRYILNFGANPYESHEFYTGFIGRWIEAQCNRKAKVVTFDVRLSHTAGNSDEWFPINPATDGAVALAMAHVIVSSNLHDRNFMERWTNLSFSALAQHLTAYTPEMAQKLSGVHASDIERIAIEFATNKPAVAVSGRGVTNHSNGVYNERCILLLNAIVGNIDAPGGLCLPRTYRLDGPQESLSSTTKRGASPREEGPRLTPHRFLSLVNQGRMNPKLYFLYEANPAYVNPESRLSLGVLKDEKKIPYIVVADHYMTETASLADLVLPTATYLESWGLDSSPALDLVPFVALQQPIVRPRGSSVAISDVMIEMAHRIGGGLARLFPYESTEQYLQKVVSSIERLEKAGGWSYLKESGVWLDSRERPRYRSYESRGFRTPSKKMEIYSERLRRSGFQPLPAYEPVGDHGDLRGKFVLVTFEPNVMGSRTGNLPWVAEIKHHNVVWLNRDVAKQLHIEEGDRVKISTSAGFFISDVRLTFGLHPRVVAMERNLGHWAFGHIARGKKFKSQDPNTELVWWEKEGNGISPNIVISGNADPIGGGEAYNDTLVTISKVRRVTP